MSVVQQRRRFHDSHMAPVSPLFLMGVVWEPYGGLHSYKLQGL